jgi:hypothetical protein
VVFGGNSVKTKRIIAILGLCLAAFGISSCVPKPVQAVDYARQITPVTFIVPVTEILTPTPEPTKIITPVPTAHVLPPDPQPVTFKAADGTELHGYYYPAAMNPAPLVVMMHWAGDDMSMWYEVAVWLQNRGLTNPFPPPDNSLKFGWWDSSWFPDIPADKSYGVFLFTFRGCNSFTTGCIKFDSAGWLQDAQAALLAAREVEGVDPDNIVAIGSSIGADGAVDGCLHLQNSSPGVCKGALSLSPDSYLNITFDQAVTELGQADPPIPVWCLAAPFQFAPCKRAEKSGNTAYASFEIPNGQHGTSMLRPGLNPLPMQLILDFLDEVLE